MSTLSGFIAILMWGFLAVFSTFTQSVPPFLLLFYCFAIAFLLLIIKRLVVKQSLWITPQFTVKQYLYNIGGLFGFHFCYFLAIRFAPAVEVSLIGYLWPLLLGIFVASAQHRNRALLGGIIGFAGSASLILGGSDTAAVAANSSDSLRYWGYLLAFVCALIWSSYSWYLSKLDSSVDDIGWVALFSSLLALLAHGVFESPMWQTDTITWLNIVLLGLGPVGGAFYLWDIGMKRGNRTLLASLSFGTPVLSTVALFGFGLAPLSTWVLTAVAGIMLGALISNGIGQKRRFLFRFSFLKSSLSRFLSQTLKKQGQ